MMFENTPKPQPSLRSMVVRHIPIAAVVLGALATMVALHLAVTAVLVVAVAHVVVGLVLLVVARLRPRGEVQQ